MASPALQTSDLISDISAVITTGTFLHLATSSASAGYFCWEVAETRQAQRRHEAQWLWALCMFTLHPNPGALPDPHFVFSPRARGRRGLRNLLCASTAAPLQHAPVILLTLKKYVCARACMRTLSYGYWVIEAKAFSILPPTASCSLHGIYSMMMHVVLAQEQTEVASCDFGDVLLWFLLVRVQTFLFLLSVHWCILMSEHWCTCR